MQDKYINMFLLVKIKCIIYGNSCSVVGPEHPAQSLLAAESMS